MDIFFPSIFQIVPTCPDDKKNILEKAHVNAWTCVFLGGEGLNLNSSMPGHCGQHCSRHAQSHCGGHKHEGARFSISLVGMLVHGCCLQRKLLIWNQPLIDVVGDGCHGTFLTPEFGRRSKYSCMMIIFFEIYVANAIQWYSCYEFYLRIPRDRCNPSQFHYMRKRMGRVCFRNKWWDDELEPRAPKILNFEKVIRWFLPFSELDNLS